MPKEKRPRDPNQLAHYSVGRLTGQIAPPHGREKDAIAVALGRKGGVIGGKARAAAMTPQQRSEAARRAAKARWRSR